MLKNISLEDAYIQIKQTATKLEPAVVKLNQAAGRISAEIKLATAMLPACFQSAVDGYALGTAGAVSGTLFSLVEEIPSLLKSMGEIGEGQAQAVKTGYPIPIGGKSVIPHEKCRIEGTRLTILEDGPNGQNIKAAGEDFRPGDLLVKEGQIMDSGIIAVLAAMGETEAVVGAIPGVCIVTLGGNVVDYSEEPDPGQVRDSNTPMLEALIQQTGAEFLGCIHSGQADHGNADQLGRQIRKADLAIFTGGTYAKGENEAETLLGSLDAEIFFWGVDIQPGSHVGLARLGKTVILALSGNPAACAVGFHLFAAPALKIMMGEPLHYSRLTAVCVNGFDKAARTRRFVRGRATISETGLEVEVLAGQKPSMMRSLIGCNALIDIPAGSPPLGAGSRVQIILTGPVGIGSDAVR